MKRSSLEFRIPSAALRKRFTIAFIIGAPDIHRHEVLVSEANCANEFLEERVLVPRSTGTNEQELLGLGPSSSPLLKWGFPLARKLLAQDCEIHINQLMPKDIPARLLPLAVRIDGSHHLFPQHRLALLRLFACQTEGCRRDCLQPGLGNGLSASLA